MVEWLALAIRGKRCISGILTLSRCRKSYRRRRRVGKSNWPTGASHTASIALRCRAVLLGRRDGGNTARCRPVAGPCLRSHLRPFLCHGLSASYPLSWRARGAPSRCIPPVFRTRLAYPAQCARILCGDLNTPQVEPADGRITTWGQVIAPHGSVRTWTTRRDPVGRVDTGDRWDAAERNVLVGLTPFDLPDVFRTLHGYGVAEWSWDWKGKGRCIGRRFDHVFASRRLHAVRSPQNTPYRHRYRGRETGRRDIRAALCLAPGGPR